MARTLHVYLTARKLQDFTAAMQESARAESAQSFARNWPIRVRNALELIGIKDIRKRAHGKEIVIRLRRWGTPRFREE